MLIRAACRPFLLFLASAVLMGQSSVPPSKTPSRRSPHQFKVLAHGEVLWTLDRDNKDKGLTLYLLKAEHHVARAAFFPEKPADISGDYSVEGVSGGEPEIDKDRVPFVPERCKPLDRDQLRQRALATITLPLPKHIGSLRGKANDDGKVFVAQGCAQDIEQRFLPTIVVFTFDADRQPTLTQNGKPISRRGKSEAFHNLDVFDQPDKPMDLEERRSHVKEVEGAYNGAVPNLNLHWEERTVGDYLTCVRLDPPTVLRRLSLVDRNEEKTLAELGVRPMMEPCTAPRGKNSSSKGDNSARHEDHDAPAVCMPLGSGGK